MNLYVIIKWVFELGTSLKIEGAVFVSSSSINDNRGSQSMLNSSQFSKLVTREDPGALRKHCRNLFKSLPYSRCCFTCIDLVNVLVQFCPMGKEYTNNIR